MAAFAIDDRPFGADNADIFAAVATGMLDEQMVYIGVAVDIDGGLAVRGGGIGWFGWSLFCFGRCTS